MKHNSRSRAARLNPSLAVLASGALALILIPLCSSPVAAFSSMDTTSYGNPRPFSFAQDDESGDESPVPSGQIEKYVAVYKAMQRNRSLTAEQAAAKQGLTLEQFRDLENRIQRDDAALQQARDELQAAARKSSPNPEKSNRQ